MSASTLPATLVEASIKHSLKSKNKPNGGTPKNANFISIREKLDNMLG